MTRPGGRPLSTRAEATACGTQLLRVKPQFAHRGRRLIAYYVKSDELRDTIVEGLRKAGVEVA